jgi:uncharacterized integral membrane protein (TIGR00697 family)
MTNEILFILVTIISLSGILLTIRLGTHWLVGLSAVYLLIANIFASKLSVVFGITTSLAIPLYAAIFLATDMATEHFGRRLAYKIVWLGFLAQLGLVVFSQLISRATTFGNPVVADALSIVFGFLPRIAVGSFIAYVISQNFDVLAYDFMKKKCHNKHLWLRNCVSTTLSQGIDSAIFLTIAFYGKLPNLGQFFLSVWVIKVAVAFFDTPFIYMSYFALGKKFKSNRPEKPEEL